jgi:hypothetical protein|tara:strand:- start:176 stop:643 length:468 start_codon:yes stop_codon:yes gene_type:complete
MGIKRLFKALSPARRIRALVPRMGRKRRLSDKGFKATENWVKGKKPVFASVESLNLGITECKLIPGKLKWNIERIEKNDHLNLREQAIAIKPFLEDELKYARDEKTKTLLETAIENITNALSSGKKGQFLPPIDLIGEIHPYENPLREQPASRRP